ncbi:MAG: transglutaminase-like domain-containing protein [Acidobacteriota bacterium]
MTSSRPDRLVRPTLVPCGLLALLLSLPALAAPEHPSAAEAGYAIVISRTLIQDSGWKKIVRELESRHPGAHRLLYQRSPLELRDELARLHPRHACFVLKAEDAARPKLVALSRMARALDDDPYVDMVWGVVSGRDSRAAQAFLGMAGPVPAKKGAFLNPPTPLLIVSSQGMPAKHPGFNVLELLGEAHVHQVLVSLVAGHVGMSEELRLRYFSEPGRYSLAEAAYFSQQDYLRQMALESPKLIDAEIEAPDPSDRSAQGESRRTAARDRRLRLAQRDGIAFFGDPAERVHLIALPGYGWGGQVIQGETPNRWVLNVISQAAREPLSGAPAFFLPQRIGAPTVRFGEEARPLITDDFIIVQNTAAMKRRETIRVEFEAPEPTAKTLAPLPIADPWLAAPPRRGSPASPVVKDGPVAGPEPESAPKSRKTGRLLRLFPRSQRDVLAERFAGLTDERRQQLTAVADGLSARLREDYGFLLSHLPDHDLAELPAHFLASSVTVSAQARKKAPWARSIPESTWRAGVLPLTSVTEKREDWRGDFHRRFASGAWKQGSIEKAVPWLNKEVFEQLGVKYHATKRKRPDQGPYESSFIGFASCTGLSVLLIDACRAVGIPARFAGTPLWMDRSGNHSWVEVFDGTRWRSIEAADANARFDHAWWTQKAGEADATKPEHRIYATSFVPTGQHFPMVWAEQERWVHAVDVTRRYREVAEAQRAEQAQASN